MQEATITAKTQVTPDVYQYTITLDEGEFDGELGQHTVLTGDGVDSSKPYTAVGLDKDSIVLMIRSYPDGRVSKWIGEQEVGDTVSVKPALSGNLTLDTSTACQYDHPAVFIATGTGITPLLGLLHNYLQCSGQQAIFVLGEKNRDQLMYKALFEQYEQLHNFEFVPVLSREEWHGLEGYVQEHIDGAIPILNHADYYVCGVPPAVVAIKKTLRDHGVDEDRIVTEGWEDGVVSE